MSGNSRGPAAGAPRRPRSEALFGAPAQAEAPRAARSRTPAPRELRGAALVVGLEALAIGVVAGYLVVLLLTRPAEDRSSAVGVVVLAVLGAAALAAVAAGLWRVAEWVRGPLIVLHLLLAVVGATMAFQAHLPAVGLPVLAVVAVVGYLMLTPAARLAYQPVRR